MTDTDPLQALEQRIEAWLRYVYDPQRPPRWEDGPAPGWVVLHDDLRELEQRCTDEGWPAALRNRLRALRRRLSGRRLVEEHDPQGLLACRRCGGGMVMTEISVINHKDPNCLLVDVFPEEAPDNRYDGAAIAIILSDHEEGSARLSDYAGRIAPDDQDTQGIEFQLWCSRCRTAYAFDVLFTPAGTRFYWNDWKETTQEGTA